MNWLMAHRVAGIAAANLRRRLDLPEDDYVDMFAALERSGLAVMGQDMPNLFGAYFPPGPGRDGGILLNSRMDEPTIRHTAAHELGHAEMGHDNCIVDSLDPFTLTSAKRWTDEEKQAEAFAAWFMMPIAAVKTFLIRLGLHTPREAADAYQLSLHLGTSYRGTVRHLVNLRMIPAPTGNGWAGIPPARLRARLCGRTRDIPNRVWDLGSLTEGCRLRVEQGDRLLVRAPWLGIDPRLTGPAQVTMRGEPQTIPTDEGVELDIADKFTSETPITLTSQDGSQLWSATLLPASQDRRGLIAFARPQRLVGQGAGAHQ